MLDGIQVASFNFTRENATASEMVGETAGVVADNDWTNLYIKNNGLHVVGENYTNDPVTHDGIGISLVAYDTAVGDGTQNSSLMPKDDAQLDGDTSNSKLFNAYYAAQQQQEIKLTLTNLDSFADGAPCDVYVYLGGDQQNTDTYNYLFDVCGHQVGGATPDQHDPDTYTDKPAHLVFLSPYYMATTEVTNRLWRAVMNEREMLNLSGYPEHPVSFVSWLEAQEFIRRLDSITGMPFRLPTEAEWEFAARGGEQSKHFRFAGSNEADTVGWLFPVAGQWTHPVASKRPNELGLYDMTGNVAEWCQDIYGPYELSTRPDPCGAESEGGRIDASA